MTILNDQKVCGTSSKEPRYLDMLGAAGQLKDVINHLCELKNTIGIINAPVPCEPEEKKCHEPSLVSVLNELPNEIRKDCSEIHDLISDIANNLN